MLWLLPTVESHRAGSYIGSTLVLLRPGPQAVGTHVDVPRLTKIENLVKESVEVP